MVDALRDASPWTLTFATGTFSPAARQVAFTTLRHVEVKRRLVLRPVPPGLELSEDLLDLIAKFLLRNANVHVERRRTCTRGLVLTIVQGQWAASHGRRLPRSAAGPAGSSSRRRASTGSAWRRTCTGSAL